MKTTHWIRLDIPYQSDGSKMRATCAYSQEGETFKIIYSDYYQNIPLTLAALEETLKSDNISTNEKTVLIYPQDGRMNLAWVLKEAADEKKWQFSRNIPEEYYPNEEVMCSFELEQTGSAEDDLSQKDAQQLIFSLNNGAREDFSTGMNMPDAMTKLRQALQLTLKHFGWASPGTAYCLTNFMHVMRGTGNRDNIKEATAAIDRMVYLCEQQLPPPEQWKGSGSIMDQLIAACDALGMDGFIQSTKLKLLKSQIGL